MTATFRGFVDDSGVFTLDPLDAAKFKAYRQRFKGEECEFDFRKRRTKRSQRQNAAYHAMLTPWAHQEGHNIEHLKRVCLEEVFGLAEAVHPLTGEVTTTLKEPHTSTLSTVQFAELMERTCELAAGCGVILELPDEYKQRRANEARPPKGRAA